VSDETVPQFGPSLRQAPGPAAVTKDPRATRCPTCGAHFSPDGRFCPFDGTALVAAVGWHPSADELLGTVVDGRYELLRVIGQGGMGTVYEVRHRALGKRFALKALRKDLARDAEIAARFIQEARTAAAVSHPGLVEITDFGRLETGQVYFVMELLEGESLAALLRRSGPLPAARALAIVRQLAHAVKAAHDASIVHRDLKPDNIHLGRGDASDVVKVVDFGLAKVIGSSKLTRAGVVFGTPHYMSPEQAAGESVDHRADIYSLGIVMYEMFTGKVPFEADSYMGVLTKHLHATPAPPSSLGAAVEPLGALEDVILRCLQKRPDARYDDLSSLLSDLDERSRRPAKVARPVAPPTTVRSLRRRLLVVGLAFAGGASLVLAVRGRSSEPSATRGAPAVATSGPNRAPLVEAAIPPQAPPVPPPPTAPTQLPSATSVGPARKPANGVHAVSPSRSPAAPKSPPTVERRVRSDGIIDPWAR
jgi:eukaryotic-like serine/threonine-protein kinase